MPREIVVDYTVPGASGPLSVFYFDSSGSVSAQRDELDTMFTAMASQLSSTVSWNVRTSGRVLDNATGALTGEWSDPSAATGSGSNAGAPVANATCLLLRWSTGDLHAGRFVRGRTFIPGMAAAQMTDGAAGAAAVSAVSSAGQGLIIAGVGFGVWHRPSGGTGGAFYEANNATCWTELAVQRRRR